MEDYEIATGSRCIWQSKKETLEIFDKQVKKYFSYSYHQEILKRGIAKVEELGLDKNYILPKSKSWTLGFYNQNFDSPLDRILQGKKTIETRALNPEETDRYFGNIKNGDKLVFKNKENGDQFEYFVAKVDIFKNLEQAVEKGLDFTKVTNLGSGYTLLDVKNWYQQNLGQDYYNKIEKNGLVAIEFAKLENHPKTLVLTVHGGNSTCTRKDDGILVREIVKNQYSTNQNKEVWSENLDKELNTPNTLSINPLFPNAVDANYSEWARFFEQILLSDVYLDYSQVILVGHSLGTVFLQRYLAENNFQQKFNKQLLGVHFVGCCTAEGDFEISQNWQNILNQLEPKNIFLYHSTDDIVCPFEMAETYNKNLDGCNFNIFQDRGHFEQVKLEELVLIIKKVLNIKNNFNIQLKN